MKYINDYRQRRYVYMHDVLYNTGCTFICIAYNIHVAYMYDKSNNIYTKHEYISVATYLVTISNIMYKNTLLVTTCCISFLV